MNNQINNQINNNIIINIKEVLKSDDAYNVKDKDESNKEENSISRMSKKIPGRLNEISTVVQRRRRSKNLSMSRELRKKQTKI